MTATAGPKLLNGRRALSLLTLLYTAITVAGPVFRPSIARLEGLLLTRQFQIIKSQKSEGSLMVAADSLIVRRNVRFRVENIMMI